MTYKVKIGKEVDTNAVNEIFKSIGWDLRANEKWVSVTQRSTFCIQILKDNKVVGFGRTMDDTDYCMIYDVVVHKDFQKQGVGKILMDEIMKYVKSHNFTNVRLFYWTKNDGLSMFYEKFGFEKMPNGMGLKK